MATSEVSNFHSSEVTDSDSFLILVIVIDLRLKLEKERVRQSINELHYDCVTQ